MNAHRFRKRPVEIEAVQAGGDPAALLEWIESCGYPALRGDSPDPRGRHARQPGRLDHPRRRRRALPLPTGHLRADVRAGTLHAEPDSGLKEES